jgi:hypothetical protein
MSSTTRLLCLVTLSAAAACSREPPPAPKTGLGNVMVQVARRFELAGRAAVANRFELAEFEAGEIQETFENDVPGAELPKEGPTAQILPLAKAFLETNAKELHDAAEKKDRAAFDAAFQRAAAACNTCHEASAKAFIHVPSEPGKPVPDVEPVPASSR